MPYDKGDFTQQGIDGKVAGGLLLNNKRDVDVLVSSNEDDSTLSLIAVTVEDHLNDLKYAFFGENLEAGEVYEIGAGGGSSITPILSLTTTSNSSQYNTTVPAIVDNHAFETVKLSGGETADIIVLGQKGPGGQIAFGYIVANKGEGLTCELTDLVNCTLFENESIIALDITDPDQNASATLHFNQEII